MTDALITHVPCQLRLLVYSLCYDDRLYSSGKRNASVCCLSLSLCHVMTHQESALVTASARFVPNVAPNILLVETEAKQTHNGHVRESQAAQLRQPCVNSHWLSQWEALGTRHF